MVELVGGGSVINGATPSSLSVVQYSVVCWSAVYCSAGQCIFV